LIYFNISLLFSASQLPVDHVSVLLLQYFSLWCSLYWLNTLNLLFESHSHNCIPGNTFMCDFWILSTVLCDLAFWGPLVNLFSIWFNVIASGGFPSIRGTFCQSVALIDIWCAYLSGSDSYWWCLLVSYQFVPEIDNLLIWIFRSCIIVDLLFLILIFFPIYISFSSCFTYLTYNSFPW